MPPAPAEQAPTSSADGGDTGKAVTFKIPSPKVTPKGASDAEVMRAIDEKLSLIMSSMRSEIGALTQTVSTVRTEMAELKEMVNRKAEVRGGGGWKLGPLSS